MKAKPISNIKVVSEIEDIGWWSKREGDVRKSKIIANESKRKREIKPAFVSTANSSPNDMYVVSVCGKQNLNAFIHKIIKYSNVSDY